MKRESQRPPPVAMAKPSPSTAHWTARANRCDLTFRHMQPAAALARFKILPGPGPRIDLSVNPSSHSATPAPRRGSGAPPVPALATSGMRLRPAGGLFMGRRIARRESGFVDSGSHSGGSSFKRFIQSIAPAWSVCNVRCMSSRKLPPFWAASGSFQSPVSRSIRKEP